MKRYIIKNADGSEQYVMPAIHDTYKSALQTLSNYLIMAADGVNDDCTESLSDYIIEKVDEKHVNEIVTDFENAKKVVGSSKFILAEDSCFFHNVELNQDHIKALIALNKLFTIAQAWNKEDGFVPNFSDWEQDKWFPWFKYDKDAEGFVCSATYSAPTVADANVGSRLCFKTSERAAQFGKQFIDLYNKVFL